MCYAKKGGGEIKEGGEKKVGEKKSDEKRCFTGNRTQDLSRGRSNSNC